MTALLGIDPDIEAILRAFDEDDKAGGVSIKSCAVFDDLDRRMGWGAASRIWQAACYEYDRRHMTPEDYAANYGGED